MNKSSKFSLIGLLVVVVSLSLLDWQAETEETFIYNQIIGVILIIGICLTVVGGYLTKYDPVEIKEDSK